MIAAQLLAYYFTELKDDQVKKVSPAGAALATALHSRIRSPPPASSPSLSQAASGWTTAGDRPRAGIHQGIVSMRACAFFELGGWLKTPLPEAGLHTAVSLKRAVDVRWVPAKCRAGTWLGGDQRACL